MDPLDTKDTVWTVASSVLEGNSHAIRRTSPSSVATDYGLYCSKVTTPRIRADLHFTDKSFVLISL